jgi:membrane protein implicated in regulation of membrane protease activity
MAAMVWWLWVVGGLALLVLEMVTPGGLFALFFGVGALCVSGLAAAGAGPVLQWVTFPLLSVVLLATLRGRLQERLRSPASARVDSLLGQEVLLIQDVPAGGEGKAELRGVPWTARAEGGGALSSGQRCKVERVDGVVLYVTAV